MPDCNFCGRFVNTASPAWMCGCDAEASALRSTQALRREALREKSLPSTLSGEDLFDMYVSIGLCTVATYEWEKLSPALQGRWDRLAFNIRSRLLKD
jgi:hypothetical protein